MKIISWNKGSKFMINKMTEINLMLKKYNPHIFTMSEAQIRKCDISKLKFDNYHLECDNLIKNNHRARSCILIHKDIKYERLYESEPDFCSVVVIEVGLKYQRKFIVIQWYRQWKLLFQKDSDEIKIQNKKDRCAKVVESWKQLSLTKEVHMVGDINLDSETDVTGYKKTMIDTIEENIL